MNDVDLPVRQGEVLALIGPSGCGKTTLLRSLNRLTELTATATARGHDHARRRDVDELEVTELRRRVSMVFQQPNPFPMSIFDNVAYALREQGSRRPRKHELRAPVEDALRRAGLWDEVADDLDHPALRLSGGQQQRLCIARALAARPEVLLMDEPCSALDPRSTATIEELIVELREEVAVVIVTHNLQQAYRVADHVAFMYLGDLDRVRAGRAGLRRAARAAHARLRRRGVRVRRMAVALVASSPSPGCESTQDKADRLARRGQGRLHREGPARDEAQPRRARSSSTAVLTDPNGAAAVVVLRNTRARPRWPRCRSRSTSRAPAARRVFRNDAPGLEPSLVSVPVIRGGGQALWVNDQVVAAEKPRKRAGEGRHALGQGAAQDPAACCVQGVRFERLSATGLSAVGFVRNNSDVEQRDLVLFGIARRGKKIVAAGRAQVRRIKPRRAHPLPHVLHRRPARRRARRQRSPEPRF